MRITQGTFSYLPELTDARSPHRSATALDNGWPLSVEYTDDRTRVTPTGDVGPADVRAGRPGGVLLRWTPAAGQPERLHQAQRLRRAGSAGQTTRLSFLCSAPPRSPGSGWSARRPAPDRPVHTHSYATDARRRRYTGAEVTHSSRTERPSFGNAPRRWAGCSGAAGRLRGHCPQHPVDLAQARQTPVSTRCSARWTELVGWRR